MVIPYIYSACWCMKLMFYERQHLPPIEEQPRPSPIHDQPRQSLIRDQLHRSPPQTQSTPVSAPDQTLPKVIKNVRGKSHLQQWKMSSKATKGKKPVKELKANLKLPTAMTHANPKFQMGKLMLTVDVLKQVGKSCVELCNYYISNYKTGQDIIVSFKECHFLVGNNIFHISWSNLYDLFNLDVFDISLMCCSTL
jgi:hypothetical protein